MKRKDWKTFASFLFPCMVVLLAACGGADSDTTGDDAVSTASEAASSSEDQSLRRPAQREASSNENGTGRNQADTDSMVTGEGGTVITMYKPKRITGWALYYLSYRVADIEKWKSDFPLMRDEMYDNGVAAFLTFTDTEEPDRVHIVLRAQRWRDGSTYLASTAFIQAGERLGVLDSVIAIPVLAHQTVTGYLSEDCILMRHRVLGWDVWKDAFFEAESRRENAGLKLVMLARGHEDPNYVVTLFSTTDMTASKRLLTSQSYLEHLEKVGTQQEAEIEFMKNIPVEFIPPEGEIEK